MSSSSRGACALLLLACSGSGVCAQTFPPTDYYWVKAFARAAFPEVVAGNVLEVTLHGMLDSEVLPPVVLFRVHTGSQPDAKPEDQARTLISGQFVAAPAGTLETASFEYPAGDETKSLQLLTEHTAAHPEWTEADLVRALRANHAQYPFDRRDAFVQHLDVDRFAPVLGRIRKAEVDFVWRRPEGPEIVVINWRVRLETLAADGRLCRYRLAFEPMRGRLVRLVREQ